MKSQVLGKNTSAVNIQAVGPRGIWILVKGEEYFLPFDGCPWFKSAKVSEVYNVELVSADHLRWPDLDVDLEIESLKHPEQYPLMYL